VLHPRRTHFPIPGYDDRAMKALAHLGRERYQRQSPLNPIGGECVGGRAPQTPRQRRLAARPDFICGTQLPLRPTQDRSLCVCAQ
jgi:hypothetical protein